MQGLTWVSSWAIEMDGGYTWGPMMTCERYGFCRRALKNGLGSDSPLADIMVGSVALPSPQFFPRAPCPAPSIKKSTSAVGMLSLIGIGRIDF